MKIIAAIILATLTTFASAKTPKYNYTVDGKRCLAPYWPFQSFTHEWSCVKGEAEAKSTWNLYNVKDPLYLDLILSGRKDFETIWYVRYEVEGEGMECGKFKRKDGLVHSLIIGQEYTQTCTDGKLGFLTPLLDHQ